MMPEVYEFHEDATPTERELIVRVFNAEEGKKVRIGRAAARAHASGLISREGLFRVLAEAGTYKTALLKKEAERKAAQAAIITAEPQMPDGLPRVSAEEAWSPSANAIDEQAAPRVPDCREVQMQVHDRDDLAA